ncbi:biotin/lipoyl-containing protein, partial [Rhodococcus koreensis]|uniref:biotin/lipoyl-containing protein n=1 Tax=Rhodococcus koreensis TaxID=99653 RepID=UPI0036DD7C1A
MPVVRREGTSAQTFLDQHETTRTRNMALPVYMPALGESVTEGTVTRWLKQEGDTVEVDEPLL